jgi:hypothetical protein
LLIAIGVFLLAAWAIAFLVFHVASDSVHLLVAIAMASFAIRLFSDGRRSL